MEDIKPTHLVAGGAGFIGVNLVKRLIECGEDVLVLDNFSMLQQSEFSSFFLGDPPPFIRVDLSSISETNSVFSGLVKEQKCIHTVWHLAANSDIPAGVEDPEVDFKDTFRTTLSLLKACKNSSVKNFNFASSSAVYGDWGERPLRESLGPLNPISNYGAMKLASEALISSARHDFLATANVFRFPNVIGVPATHGVIYDFVQKLGDSPDTLEVLGNGLQQKSYLHVEDLIDAMVHLSFGGYAKEHETPLIVNVGSDDHGVSVSDIAKSVVAKMSPSANVVFGNDSRGWLGDVPKFRYDTSKIKALGWCPRLSSREAVLKAVGEIIAQETGEGSRATLR